MAVRIVITEGRQTRVLDAATGRELTDVSAVTFHECEGRKVACVEFDVVYVKIGDPSSIVESPASER